MNILSIPSILLLFGGLILCTRFSLDPPFAFAVGYIVKLIITKMDE